MGGYFEPEYIEEDYFEDDFMAITPLPDPPLRSDDPALFVQKADLYLSALVKFALELDALALSMNNNSTSSRSTTSQTIASSGSKTFTVDTGKSYLPGQTVKAASTVDGTIWMQGDVTAYNPATGILSITMNASQGSGTIADWTLTLSVSVANPTGSLSNDFTVKSLRHAIATPVASAATLDLSSVTGNFAHITGNNGITGVTMVSGKDVWVEFDSTPTLTYHATNLKLNSGGANITAVAGDRAYFSFDGTTVTVTYVKVSGKANVESPPPAGAPVGSALIHFGSSAPAGYLVCPTSQTNVSRTTYATLFAAIGTTWGTGDGSTTFGLPWFAANYAMVQASSNVGTATVGQNLSHTHTYEDVDNSGTPAGGTYFTGSVGNLGTKTTSASGGTANLAAGSRVLICVKYQ